MNNRTDVSVLIDNIMLYFHIRIVFTSLDFYLFCLGVNTVSFILDDSI